MQFSDDFLRTVLIACVLRYLAVAHFGRGRGNFVEGEAPPFWQAEVEQAIALHEHELSALWPALRKEPDPERAAASVKPIITRIAFHTLSRLYPAATHFIKEGVDGAQ